MSTDALVVLKDEHREMKRLFRDFEKAEGDVAKKQLVEEITQRLLKHTYMEEEVLYPQVRELVPDLEDEILESYEEHHVVDVLLVELAGMEPSHERYDAKVSVLIENVEHHIEEEEETWFPKVREAVGRKDLQEMGASMLAQRDDAPTTPSAG